MLDIFSAVTMLSTNGWSNDIFNQCKDLDGCIFIPFQTGRWLFVGCIIFSFLLVSGKPLLCPNFTYSHSRYFLSSPTKQERQRKLSPVVTFHTLSPTSWPITTTLCVSRHTPRLSTHKLKYSQDPMTTSASSTTLATLPRLATILLSSSSSPSRVSYFYLQRRFPAYISAGWKQVLLADAPRQTINALTLYAIYLAKRNIDLPWYDPNKWFNNKSISTSLLTVTTFLTVLVFAGSLLLLIAAAVCYIPLLVHIQGNLKVWLLTTPPHRMSADYHIRNTSATRLTR